MDRLPAVIVSASLLPVVCGCGDTATLPAGAGVGERPAIPAPVRSIFPTVHIATAKGWANGSTPRAAEGLSVHAFAEGLDHPRWLYVLPNGDVLVAETNAPPRPEDGKGIMGWFVKQAQARAGAGVPSADRITLLRDDDGDGVAETRTVFLAGLYSPFGMALVGDTFYVANSNAVVRFPYRAGATKISAVGTVAAELPAGPINHHWTKNIIASADGKRLYATVGSNSNAGERGVDKEERRAAILEIDLATGASRVFASGLRNPNGLGWDRTTGALWTVVNERDELGSDLVPDYLTSVKDSAFYGWPYSYYGQHMDERVKPPRPDLVETAVAPDYALGAHVAPLGMVFAAGKGLPPRFSEGVFVGQHGSWNRQPFNGYNVVFVPFSGGRPAGKPVEVLSGFIDSNDEALGRPVGVAVDATGALLVADDVGNTIWRVEMDPSVQVSSTAGPSG
ncbi:MAG: sorbosone dehydrogenase family protein [Gammaproteobacteria bacterium]